MYDIIIIGSGPAGSIFAKLIDKKCKVLLISTNNIKEKPCGGLLSPDAGKCLAELNLTMPKDILVDPQIFSVNVIDNDNNLKRNYQRCYINFNRKKFDDWLLSLVKDKVNIISGIVTKIEKETNFKITLKTNKKEITYKSKYLIGADGASSITRKTFFKERKIEKLLSIQEWYKKENTSLKYSCIFDSKITPTYAWTFVKDEYLIYGGAFHGRKEFEKGSKSIGLKPIKREACLITNTKRMKDIITGKNNVFLLGEAAGFISPSSYEGISFALTSAMILSKVFNENDNNLNKIYNKKTIKLKLKMLTKIIKAKLCNKLLRKIIMKSGIQSIKVINNENNI